MKMSRLATVLQVKFVQAMDAPCRATAWSVSKVQTLLNLVADERIQTELDQPNRFALVEKPPVCSPYFVENSAFGTDLSLLKYTTLHR